MNRLLIALVVPLLASSSGAAFAQERYDVVGVELSARERAVSRPVTLPDGRVVLRPDSDGIPWLFGLGDVYGAPSGLPTVNGVTPSAMASTPSGGLVPGQEPK